MTHTRRRTALRVLARAAELDAVLVTDLVNVRYLTGFTGSSAAALINAADTEHDERRTRLVTDARYTTQAAEQVPELARVVERACAVAAVTAAVADGVRRLGFESGHVTVDGHAALRAIDGAPVLVRAPDLVQRLRVVKDDTEIAALATACAAADAALADLLAAGGLRPGRTERQVAAELEQRMREHGAEGRSFETIVAAGKHSAIPHHRPTDAVLARGDLVKLDFGALYGGYHSDMTRTMVLGPPAIWQRELYELVAISQAAGMAALAVDAELAGVDAAAREVIKAAGRGEEFCHGLGHGVGLQIHEAPALAATAEGRLADGMTVTVEPGVYLAGRGGVRIEDTLVVRPHGAKLLTRTDRELLAL
ncbi:MAG: aminopeptidase P family protein [Actinomycetota bacterium]|nr:aminopeptidase P family protein [Actinomycetota bacterium]